MSSSPNFGPADSDLVSELSFSQVTQLVYPEFRNADLWLYRERTIALLRRYPRISIEVGRLPSLLGRELFRSKVTSYRMSSFEDAVIFVHDVEGAVEQLDAFAKEVVATIVFQDYTHDEAAEVLRCGRRTVCRVFPEAIDRITDVFLEGGLLNRLPPVPVENSCQEGESADLCKVWHNFLFEMIF